jgi:hypothetical protein
VRFLSRSRPKRVTKLYGLGSLLAVVSLPIAYLTASRGGNGWQERSARDAERDALVMAEKGYRVVAAEERSVPALGMYWQKVTYELFEQPR